MEEEGYIAGSGLLGGHTDDETDKADTDGSNDVPEFLLGAVGVPCVDQGDDTSESPRGSTHEKSRHVAETQRLCERGEESVERETDDVGGKGQHEDVDFQVFEGHEETIEYTVFFAVFICFTDIFDHAELGNLQLLLGETARVVRQIGKHDSGSNGNAHGNRSLDPEQPSPSCVTKDTLHVGKHTCANQSGESVGDEVTAEQDCVSGGQFAAGVPFRQDEQGAGEESGFDETKAETDGDHAAETVDDSREG